jgi:protein-S-isoprenylcysteine O-methyltransferase Ste14
MSILVNTNVACPVSRPSVIRVCDLGELVVVVALYLWLVARLVAPAAIHSHPMNLLLLPSEGMVLICLLCRRRAEQISMCWYEWPLALTATLAPMLVQPGNSPPFVWPAVAACLFLAGIIIQLHAKLALGRSFGCVPAHRGLKCHGPYRFVRHPMYAGYLLGHLAFLLMNPTFWNVAVYGICYGFQLPRMLAEERLLEKDPQYRSYQASVRYRLIPGVF